MLRWAKSSALFRCVHVRAAVTQHGRPWLGSCVQSFGSPFSSKASRQDHVITVPRVNLSASKASRIHGNANFSEFKLRRHDSPLGDAEISVLDVGSLDIDAKIGTSAVEDPACSHHNARSLSVDGDAEVSRFPACTPHSKVQSINDDVGGTETMASSCETQSLHVSMETLFKKTGKEAQEALQAQNMVADLQQKIMLLEAEKFLLSDAKKLLKARAFRQCSVEQLATALQQLKIDFPSTEVVHDIVVRSSNVLVQPAELVQQKLKLLRDFQVQEKVVSKLCGSGGVLSISMESLEKKLVFFDSIGLTVAARNKMFWKAPLILMLTIENSLQPTLKFLESTGFAKDTILKVVEQCPNMFYIAPDSLMKKYEYMRQLGFPIDKVAKAFRFTDRSSIKNIEKHLHTLRELGFTDTDIRSIVQSQPAILALSSENLKGKVDFLISKQHRNLAEIVQFPTCLMYSLQARVIPRFNALNDLDHSKGISLSCILTPSEATFWDRIRKKATQKMTGVLS